MGNFASTPSSNSTEKKFNNLTDIIDNIATDYILTTDFRVARRNWLLKDVYNVQAISKLSFKWNKNIYLAGFSGNVKLTQSTEAL